MADFHELVTEPMTVPVSGWDFSRLDRHSRSAPLPWDYRLKVAAVARSARTMLDMGTGGGEALSGLPARAPRTVATEAWPRNAPVADRRLLPLGIRVIQDEGARENMVVPDVGVLAWVPPADQVGDRYLSGSIRCASVLPEREPCCGMHVQRAGFGVLERTQPTAKSRSTASARV